MRLEGENVLCRFLLTNFMQHHHRPLYEVLVERAWRHGMAGATVLKGLMGFLLDGPMLERHPWWPSNQLPILVEMVDRQEAIESFLAEVQPLLQRGIVTLERAHVVYYRASDRDLGRTPPQVDSAEQAEQQEGESMATPEDGVLLRIFVDDCDVDSDSGRPLFDRLVRLARDMRLAGATVLRGTMGFGRHSVIHASKLFDAPMDMPVIVELVDDEKKILDFLAAAEPLVTEGLVTMEKVRVLKYRGRN